MLCIFLCAGSFILYFCIIRNKEWLVNVVIILQMIAVEDSFIAHFISLLLSKDEHGAFCARMTD